MSSAGDKLLPVLTARREEAAKLRAAIPELKAMAKGAALAAKVVPDTLAAKIAAVGASGGPVAQKLLEFANDAAEDVVTKLLEQIAKTEARAAALDEMVAQLEAVAREFADVAADTETAPPDSAPGAPPDARDDVDGPTLAPRVA